MRIRNQCPKTISGIVFFLLILAAGLVRLKGIFNDFWFDEIWSFAYAKNITSPLEVFTRIHHDNNHWLNTFYLYLIGEQPHWFAYRLLSFVTGTASVAAAGFIAHRRGRLAAFTTILLFGFSYLLVLYSSEARGYAPAILFSLLSFYFLQQYLDKKKGFFSVLFCVWAAFGFLSHLSYVFVYGAFVLWSLYRFVQAHAGWKATAVAMVRCHAAPLLLLLVLYFCDIQYMNYGGGPRYRLIDILGKTLALTFGAPETQFWMVFISFAIIFIFVFELVMLARDKRDVWVFFLAVIFLVPAMVFMSVNVEILFVRYFIVCVPFLLLMLSGFICRCYKQGGLGKIFYMLVITLILGGNSMRIGAFLNDGRGHYLDAVTYMARQTEGQTVTVGSDHDFRNRMLIVFYARYLPEGKKIVYLDSDRWPKHGPQWVIIHSQQSDYKPSAHFSGPEGNTYSLAKSYRYSGLSGWHWFVYRNTIRG